jgi:hypothetical protein
VLFRSSGLPGCGVVSMGVHVYWDVALFFWVFRSTGMWCCVSRCASLLGCGAVYGCGNLSFELLWCYLQHQTIQEALGRPYDAPKPRSLHTMTGRRYAATPSTSSSEVPEETTFLRFVLCRDI